MTAATKSSNESKKAKQDRKTVLVELDDEGIAWVSFNRPAKRNCMSPTLNQEMQEVLAELEGDDRCKLLILTGAGDAWSAGMDLKEYFRDTDNYPPVKARQLHRQAFDWQWRSLMYYLKPTIAMVNGWCFGGAFTPLVACDLAIAADEAVFGLSEINWGIIPAGGVPRAVAEVMGYRNAMYYIMTGETFDGPKAAQMGLINESVPRDKLRERTLEVARSLLAKSATTLNAARLSYKYLKDMSAEAAFDYVCTKAGLSTVQDTEHAREKALTQFLDKKTFRPGLETYDKNK